MTPTKIKTAGHFVVVLALMGLTGSLAALGIISGGEALTVVAAAGGFSLGATAGKTGTPKTG